MLKVTSKPKIATNNPECRSSHLGSSHTEISMGLDMTGEESLCLEVAQANLKESDKSTQSTGFTQMLTSQDHIS